MLFLLVSVTLIGLLLTGTGSLFGKLLGFGSMRNPWVYWWLGFFITSTLSMFASLFVPLNFVGLITFAVAGGIGVPVWYRQYKQSSAQNKGAETIVFVFLSLFFLITLVCSCAYSVWPGTAYDTDLYHAQTIRWFNEYGTPPGLGNLHTRLAFNSSWLSLAALFDNGPWDNRSAWIMPVLAWTGAFLYFLYELFFARKNGARAYALCILIWIAAYQAKGTYPALYYDDPVHILNAVAVLEAWYLLDNSANNSGKETVSHASCVLALSVSGFMIKPIGALSVIFSGVITLFLLLQNKRQSVYAWLKMYLPAVGALGIWVGRNILLSGYPLYPLPIFALPFDWTLVYQNAKGTYDAVLGWARMPGPGSLKSLENGFLFWFKPWLIDRLHSKAFYLAVFPFSLSVFLWFLVMRFVKTGKSLFFLGWSNLCILYWFLSAPDLRFGIGFFWVALGAALLFLIPPTGIFAGSSESRFDLSIIWKHKKIRRTSLSIWSLGIICMIGMTVLSSKRSVLLVGIIPSYPVKEYTVNATTPFTVWIPDGDDDRTGNSPLPSAPGPVENIELREPGNLGQGFRYVPK